VLPSGLFIVPLAFTVSLSVSVPNETKCVGILNVIELEKVTLSLDFILEAIAVCFMYVFFVPTLVGYVAMYPSRNLSAEAYLHSA
jgi:hypothetical protein